MSRFVLALDQGTTSSRAIVFDRSGKAVASAQQEFPQIFPKPGHVEHDPEAIWSTQLQTARDAIAKAGITATDIAAIGVAFGFNAGYAINPARDFGPRLFTFVAGWGSDVFTAGGGWWWVPIVAPIVGAILGAWLYDAFINKHHVAPEAGR